MFKLSYSCSTSWCIFYLVSSPFPWCWNIFHQSQTIFFQRRNEPLWRWSSFVRLEQRWRDFTHLIRNWHRYRKLHFFHKRNMDCFRKKCWRRIESIVKYSTLVIIISPSQFPFWIHMCMIIYRKLLSNVLSPLWFKLKSKIG